MPIFYSLKSYKDIYVLKWIWKKASGLSDFTLSLFNYNASQKNCAKINLQTYPNISSISFSVFPLLPMDSLIRWGCKYKTECNLLCNNNANYGFLVFIIKIQKLEKGSLAPIRPQYYIRLRYLARQRSCNKKVGSLLCYEMMSLSI